MTDQVKWRFGENLRRARESAGLSQEEVGRRASMDRTQVGILERGERAPRISTLARLCGALDVSADDLLAGINWHLPEVKEGGFEIHERGESRDQG